MPWKLTKDATEVATFGSFNTKAIGSYLPDVSFPDKVQQSWTWSNEDGYELFWVEPEPVPEQPPQVPQVVTMRQARLALYDVGKLNQINGMINAMTGASGDKARIEWEYGSTVDRNSPLTAAIAAQLNMTSAEMDTLFTTAATL